MAENLVYLCGPIAGATYEGAEGWRAKAAKSLAAHGIKALDPLRGKQELAGTGVIPFHGGRGTTLDGRTPLRTPKAIFNRDRWDVMRCDIVLAYFGETPEMPDLWRVSEGKYAFAHVQIASLGSAWEIGIAAAVMKPVVFVAPEGNIHIHPLLQQSAVVEVATLDEALDLIPVLLAAEPIVAWPPVLP